MDNRKRKIVEALGSQKSSLSYKRNKQSMSPPPSFGDLHFSGTATISTSKTKHSTDSPIQVQASTHIARNQGPKKRSMTFDPPTSPQRKCVRDIVGKLDDELEGFPQYTDVPNIATEYELVKDISGLSGDKTLIVRPKKQNVDRLEVMKFFPLELPKLHAMGDKIFASRLLRELVAMCMLSASATDYFPKVYRVGSTAIFFPPWPKCGKACYHPGLFVTMEYLEGYITMDKLPAVNRIPAKVRLDIIVAFLEAIIESRNMTDEKIFVNNDMHPENILLKLGDGNKELLGFKLIDFGSVLYEEPKLGAPLQYVNRQNKILQMNMRDIDFIGDKQIMRTLRYKLPVVRLSTTGGMSEETRVPYSQARIQKLAGLGYDSSFVSFVMIVDAYLIKGDSKFTDEVHSILEMNTYVPETEILEKLRALQKRL